MIRPARRSGSVRSAAARGWSWNSENVRIGPGRYSEYSWERYTKMLRLLHNRLIGAALGALLLLIAGYVAIQPIVSARKAARNTPLHLLLDENNDRYFNDTDIAWRSRGPHFIYAGINNTDANNDRQVDWNNNYVEDFNRLDRFVLKRADIPKGYLLFLVVDSLIEHGTLGHVRIFDIDGKELLPPGIHIERQLSGQTVALLRQQDVVFYIEGVHGFDSRLAIELRSKRGTVMTRDYRELSCMGPTAILIDSDTAWHPYDALDIIQGCNTIIIRNFSVADNLIKAMIKQAQLYNPKTDIRSLYTSRPSISGTSSIIQMYIRKILEHTDSIRIQSKTDPMVSAHLMTLIDYLSDLPDKELDCELALQLCRLQIRINNNELSPSDRAVIEPFIRRCIRQ